MKGLDVRIPFFLPLWRRVLVAALCVIWAGVEFAYGSWAWAGLMGLIASYLIWVWFLAFEPDKFRGPED